MGDLDTPAEKTSVPTVEAVLAALAGDFSRLRPRLKTVSTSASCGLPSVTLHVHYPAFRSGGPTMADFIDVLLQFISRFALPRAERNRAFAMLQTKSFEEIELESNRLRNKAVRTFIRAHEVTERQGEAGELILYLLTEWIIEAPQVLAKMSLKTNPNMPVHGADGVHVKYNPARDSIRFYFGESKMQPSLGAALRGAAKSIAKAVREEETRYEVDLVTTHIDATGLSEAEKQSLLRHLHPWTEEANAREEAVTSLLLFEYDGYTRLTAHDALAREKEFENLLAADLAKAAPRIGKIFKAAGLEAHRVELFLLPLPSVSDFRERFHAEIGWRRG